MKKSFVLFTAMGLLIATCTALMPAPSKPAEPTKSAGPAQARKATWETEWDNTLRAAKEEGKVIIYGDLNAEESGNMARAFRDKYGIAIELVAGKAAEIAARTTSERNAGLFIPDINMSGVVGSIVLLKPKGFTEKMDNALILPEVKAPNVWLNGRFPWVDSDHTQVQFIGEVFPGIIVNTKMVGAGEIKSYQDLLAPKWKGKMVLADPTTPSSGSQWFAKMTIALGEDYMQAFVKQGPAISRNDRLMVEWVAQGKYPVGVALQSAQVWKFINEGAPITVVDTEAGALSPGHGCISLMKNAPHPNAAKVLLNWLLTREGQTAFVKGSLSPSRRMDVPTTGIVTAAIPKAGRKYIEDDEESLAQRSRMADLAKKIFKPLL